MAPVLEVNDWPHGLMRGVNEYQHSSVLGSFWLNIYLFGTRCVMYTQRRTKLLISGKSQFSFRHSDWSLQISWKIILCNVHCETTLRRVNCA